MSTSTYNGDMAFLNEAARLDPYDGTALILAQPKDIPDVVAAMKQHPKRFVGLGSGCSASRFGCRQI